jgi:hypothetical protein
MGKDPRMKKTSQLLQALSHGIDSVLQQTTSNTAKKSS